MLRPTMVLPSIALHVPMKLTQKNAATCGQFGSADQEVGCQSVTSNRLLDPFPPSLTDTICPICSARKKPLPGSKPHSDYLRSQSGYVIGGKLYDFNPGG